MAKRKLHKNPNQLELDFRLSTGIIETKGTQMEFDFFNKENNFFAQIYQNKAKLKVDLLRLLLADKIIKSRKPIKKMLLFTNEATRKRVTVRNRFVFKRYGIETATMIVKK